jgi:dTDP-4-amino-4,6-dideoxygalactose transaminase
MEAVDMEPIMNPGKMKVGFNKPYMTGKEIDYLKIAHSAGKLSGDGEFTKKCHHWLETNIQTKKALLTQSCTAALEMAALLIDLKPGDEVIMPSYTFVSTANAFALRGAIPVFVDIRPDTLNMDERKIEQAITTRTKAIVPVHYAGVSCEMDTIMAIAKKYNLFVIEDAAQGILSTYKNKPLGSIGHLATFSFHETKNIISGEGGALLINDIHLIEQAEIIWEKGTNRKRFFRGQVDKYTWVDLGSSFLPSELTAAFLWAQLEEAVNITNKRKEIWNQYHNALYESERQGYLVRPSIPDDITDNAHIYYILVQDRDVRTELISRLKSDGIDAIFHYVPLHSSPGGKRYTRHNDLLTVTTSLADQIVRLPMHLALTVEMIDYVTSAVKKHIKEIMSCIDLDVVNCA